MSGPYTERPLDRMELGRSERMTAGRNRRKSVLDYCDSVIRMAMGSASDYDKGGAEVASRVIHLLFEDG